MNTRKTRRQKIYGRRNILNAADFEPRNIGHRISIVVPEDVLMTFRQWAKEKGIGYQTLMNQALRKSAFGHTNEREKLMETRLVRLEKVVFKTKQAA